MATVAVLTTSGADAQAVQIPDNSGCAGGATYGECAASPGTECSSTTSNELQVDTNQCSDGSGGNSDPPPPPPPPTAGEVEAVVCPDSVIPVSTIGRDPGGEGLTGLETYLWASAVEAMTFSGEIRGYPVTCTITPYEWTWTTGDGGAYTAGHHGGPYPDHAAEHIYETKNEPENAYTLTLSVRWRKQGSYGLDSVAVTQHAEPYHVVEVRSQLSTAPAQER